MIKATLVLFLSVALAHAEEQPKAAVPTAEQAVVRFREARDTELKDALTKEQLSEVISCSRMSGLRVTLMQSQDYQQIQANLLPGDNDPRRILGTFAAAAECKNPTWHLDYSQYMRGNLEVYLDALTGKILYLYVIGEG